MHEVDFSVDASFAIGAIRLREPDYVITAPKSSVWRQIVSKQRSAGMAVMRGELQVTGGLSGLASFMGLFEQNHA